MKSALNLPSWITRPALWLWPVVLALQTFACFTIRPDGPWDRQRVTMENWKHYGFFALRGCYVDQVEPLTPDQIQNPPVFKGHNPALFYPTFLFSSLAGSFFYGHLIFCLIASSWLYWHALAILGERNAVLAVAFCGSLAALHGWASLDPVPVSLLIFGPLLVRMLLDLLANGRCSFSLLVLCSLCASINWTTSLAIATGAGVFLLAWRRHGLKVVKYFFAPSAVSGFVVLLSLASKSDQMAYPLRDYFFTSSGYGEGLTWLSAWLKQGIAIFIFNASAWLPFVDLLSTRRCNTFPWSSAVAALVGPALVFVTLRNYVTHAPLIVAAPLAFLAILLLWGVLHNQWQIRANGSAFSFKRIQEASVFALTPILSITLCILQAAQQRSLHAMRAVLAEYASFREPLVILPCSRSGQPPSAHANYLSRLLGHPTSIVQDISDINPVPARRLLFFAEEKPLEASHFSIVFSQRLSDTLPALHRGLPAVPQNRDTLAFLQVFLILEAETNRADAP